MKLASGFISDLKSSLSTKRSTTSSSKLESKRRQLLKLFLTSFMVVGGVLAFSEFLPDDLTQHSANFMCWILVGALAAFTLLTVIKVIEGLLDA